MFLESNIFSSLLSSVPDSFFLTSWLPDSSSDP